MGILVVDDSNTNLFIFEAILKKAGYTDVYKASSAFEALTFLHLTPGKRPEDAPPLDLILLDVNMPGMDGIDACRYIKKHAVFRDLPIIFVTAAQNILAAAYAAGGMDFIRKGSDEVELLARVKSAVRLKRELDERKQREAKMLKEMQLAKHIQNSVLSKPKVEERIHIHGKYIQSAELSGDMSFWCSIDDHRYGILLIDVAGHGVSSALISMSLRSLLSGLIRRVTDPALVFQELNKHMLQLYGSGTRLMYFTAIYAVIDTLERNIHYINAGHPPGLLVKDGYMGKLDVTTVPIGVKKEPKMESVKRSYESGTRLVLYTDGLVESRGTRLSVGIEQLEQDAARYHRYDNEAFVEKVIGLRENREDDICLISVYLQ